ncbi:TRAP transporter large permease subunit, partial [Alphaproteobacteria bacterium]|nr:TRAP transporter large permease subunit [Alphaproteobacteria bacterium]
MIVELVILVLFLIATFACLLSGYPVAFGLGGAGVLVLGGLIVLSLLGVQLNGSNGWPIVETTSWRDLSPLANDVYRHMAPSGQTLLAIPLFVFMGTLLQRSALATQLFEAVPALTGRVPGGLGVAVVLVGGLLAASTGVVGASVVTLSAIALPALMRNGYGFSNAAGIVTASGTLGQVIPPSIVLILLAEQVGVQFQSAQIAQGNFAPLAITSGDLFRAALVPGILVLLGFAGWALWSGRHAARTTGAETMNWLKITNGILPPIGLIMLVLGSIITGVADTTSAASFGAVGALVLASRRVVL